MMTLNKKEISSLTIFTCVGMFKSDLTYLRHEAQTQTKLLGTPVSCVRMF